MTEQEQRAAFVAEARRWIGTPYRHGSHILGSGCDCATFIGEVLVATGLVKRDDLGIYGQADWFLHVSKERYMLGLIRHVRQTIEGVSWRSLDAKPGDIVLAKAAGSRVYNHGGIVTKWPMIIHAKDPKVTECDASRDPMWANQQVAVFSPFGGAR